MEPQDTPPYAPLERETSTPSSSRPAAPTDDRAKTRRVVAVAAGASFLAALTGMAIARSGASSSSTATTPAPTPASAPQIGTDDGQPVFPGFQDEPRAAQPGVPFSDDGGGQTRSGGS